MNESRMQKMFIEISDVLTVTPRSVRVVEAKTGKPVWLPLKHAEHYNNRVWVPKWLFDKIYREPAHESV